MAIDNEERTIPEELPTEEFGLPIAGPGKWASCIRILNPFNGETTSLVELDNNEAAFRYTFVRF